MLVIPATVLLLSVSANGQTSGAPPPDPERALFHLDPDEEAALDYLERQDTPPERLDLNRASAALLASLPGVSFQLAQAIVRFRDAFGPFSEVDDLRAIEGFTPAVVDAIRPGVYVMDAAPPNSAPATRSSAPAPRYHWTTTLTRRLERPEGYSAPDGFAGWPWRSASRLRARPTKRVEAVVVAEHDAGEPFTFDPATRAWGSDHLSASLHVSGRVRPWRLTLGDFRAGFASGLVLGQPAFGPASPARVRRTALETARVRGHHSTSEQDFFRGIALSTPIGGGIDVSALVSRRRLDARLTLDPVAPAAPAWIVGTLLRTGLHRTHTERAYRLNARETLAAIRMGRSAPWGSVGFMAVGSRLESVHDSSVPRGARAIGAYGRLSTSPAGASFELARTAGSGWAGSAALWLTPHPRTRVSAMLTRIGTRFDNPHAGGLQSTPGVDEPQWRLHLGARRTWPGRGLLEAYTNLIEYTRPRSTTRFPSRRWVSRMTGEITLGPYIAFSGSARIRTGDVGMWRVDALGRRLPGNGKERHVGLASAASIQPHDRVRLRVKARLVRLVSTHVFARPGSLERGHALAHETRLDLTRWLRIDARIVSFSTDGYGSRIYAVDPGLPGSFGLQTLHGRGERVGLGLHGRFSRFVEGWFTYGSTRYDKPRATGSGPDAVYGPMRRQVGVGVRVER